MTAFLNNATSLAMMFTPLAWAPKYLPTGFKPLEEFCSDIHNNLTEWAADGNTVFYRTKDYWYIFEKIEEGELAGVVQMTRRPRNSWARLDSWANPPSVAFVGNEFLKEHLDKRIPVFATA